MVPESAPVSAKELLNEPSFPEEGKGASDCENGQNKQDDKSESQAIITIACMQLTSYACIHHVPQCQASLQISLLP